MRRRKKRWERAIWMKEKKRDETPAQKCSGTTKTVWLNFARAYYRNSLFLSHCLLFSVSPLSSWALGGLPLFCCCGCYLFLFFISFGCGPTVWFSALVPTSIVHWWYIVPLACLLGLFHSSIRTILGLPLQGSMLLVLFFFPAQFYIPSLLPPSTPGNWPWSIRSFSLFSISPPTSPPLAKETHWNCHLGLT